MWLSWQNNQEKHQIPVLPPSFEVETSNMNTVVNINEIGNIILIGKSDLRKINISSFFPNQDYPFVTTQKRHDPYTYVDSIERWRKSGKPIRLIITETPVNIAVAIDSFKYGERDGSGDVYYSLELSEYKFTNVRQKTNPDYKPPSAGGGLTGTESRKTIPNSYIVKSGDTLSIIAKKTTGNSANYKTIAEKNNIKNPDVIFLGMELKL